MVITMRQNWKVKNINTYKNRMIFFEIQHLNGRRGVYLRNVIFKFSLLLFKFKRLVVSICNNYLRLKYIFKCPRYLITSSHPSPSGNRAYKPS